ncbi:MAG: hypothetical protein ACYCQJ_09495 [Nitrososphaerales archaeon]
MLVVSIGLASGIIAFQKTNVMVLDGHEHGDHSSTKTSPPPPPHSTNSTTSSTSSTKITSVSPVSTRTTSTLSSIASSSATGEEAGAGIATLVAGLVLFFVGRRFSKF